MELRKSLRRKGTTNMRSPAVRRNSSAEVMIKGWLFKLEGSTIKQWKKRWFILSEYCLFYYKGPDEEKFLGSILLPSYKIRPCMAEDKVSHKHAFVAEHQNMKTYYFAAENSTSMCQWMNAMCLASLMQREPQQGAEQCPRPQHENPPPSYEGVHPFRPHPAQYHHHPQQQQPPQPHPNAHYRPHDPPYDTDDYNAAENGYLLSGEQYPCSYTQSPIYDSRPNKGPVYANAPPKPRRHGNASPTNEPFGFKPSPSAEARVPQNAAQPYGALDLPMGATGPGCRYDEQYGTGPLFRPRSADFLERSDSGRESCMRKVSQAKPRPKSSMAHYDWQDEEDDEDVWPGYGELREEGQRRTSSDSRPALTDGVRQGAGARHMLAQSSLGSSLGSVQSKKTVHKEESMKRLLEWKQRMLQSPLRKKQQSQSGLSQDVYSNVKKRPVSSLGLGSSHPPERPPLPREYQVKLLKDAEMQESRATLQQQQNANAPAPPRQDPRASLGPDLIQHAKISPTKSSATESPDYVNLRNLHYPPSNSRLGRDFQDTGSKDQMPLLQQPSIPFNNQTPLLQQPTLPICTSPRKPSVSTMQHVSGNSRHYEGCRISNSGPQMATYQNVTRPRSAPFYKDSGGFTDVPPVQSSTPIEASQTKTRCFSPELGSNQERWQHNAVSVRTSQGQVEPQCYPGPPPPQLNNATPKQVEQKSTSQYSRYVQKPDATHSSKVRAGEAATQQSALRDNLIAQRVEVTRQSLSRSESDRSCPDAKHAYLADESMSPVTSSPSLRKETESPRETSSDMFAIQKEDYYRASQLFYSKQPLSKGLLSTVSDTAPESYEVETFDSRYRKNCNTPKSPEWELDKDIGLPVPDNLDLSFQSTSNNSVFEAPYETPGDQSPEFFQGTLRPSRTYVRDRKGSREDTTAIVASIGSKLNPTTPKQKVSADVRNVEEMRSTIQRKKEAPPPNIVQDRIKCFEPKESSNPAEDQKEVVESKKCPGDSDDPTPEPDESDSDSSCDVATLKSRQESQSQSASVLSDLRKTADTKKEDSSHGPSLNDVPTAPKVPTSASNNAVQVPRSLEAHYVPMGGWLTKDADYVTMSIDSSADSRASEPVYNEPMTPVPSFVHDAFVRQNAKDISGSSSDCSTENIYERVRQGSSVETSPKTALVLSGARENSVKAKDTPVYEEPYALVSAPSNNGAVGNTSTHFAILGQDNHTAKLPAKKPFPDLLHHEEVKDSGASDADDEASRADFDTAPSSLPSYQKEVLNEHLLNSGDALGFASQQSYSPVYATQTSKYSLHRERPHKQDAVTGTGSTKEVHRVPCRLTDGATPTHSAATSAKASKVDINLQIKKISGQPEMPTSLGLLRNMDCDTSSSEAGLLLCGPRGAGKVPEGPPQPGRTSESLSQVSSPLLSTAPDVLPSEVRTVVSESNNKKPPNSAPYYYSDIFGERLGQGANMRLLGQQMRITPNMLNNIREMRMNSPTPKGDIGRRVNDISISAPNGATHVRARSEPEPMTAEFESTIRGLLNPPDTRKFSDAEKNKYVAGHTLEKTSHMAHSVLSGMRKQHSPNRKPKGESTPRTGNMLPRRLSRSLEDVIDVQGNSQRSKTPIVGASDAYDEPYYENVGFSSASKPQAPRSSAGPQASVAKHSVYDGEDLCGDIATRSIVKNLFGNNMNFLGIPPTSSPMANLYGGIGHLQQKSDMTATGSGLAPVDLGRSDQDANEGQLANSGIRQALDNFARAQEQDCSTHNYSNDSLHSYNSECQLDTHDVFEMEMSSPPQSTGLSHSFSAGDLLGKSHEELVLLLIQLRRNHNNLTTSKIRYETELRTLKENLVQSDSKHSAMDVQRLVSVQRKLNELNKNLQLTQPLINLVENMVKLGSLYNITSSAKLDGARDTAYANSSGEDSAEAQRVTIEKEIETIRNMLAGGITPGGPSKEDLEVELRRLQTLVDDLLNKKRGLSILPIPDDTGKPSRPMQVNLSSTAASARKKHERTYYETDLDSGITNDVAMDTLSCKAVEPSPTVDSALISASPESEELSYLTQDISEADDRTKKFYGILPRDRAQEIKTVRIVKRESERRQRGRDHKRKGPFEEGFLQGRPDALLFHQDQASKDEDQSSDESAKHEAVFENKQTAYESSKKSDQIMTPSSSADSLSSGGRSPRRNKRNKRRHYTISGSHPFLDQHSPPKLPASLRSRDDMDMERCLRTVNTPDIVRSTIKKSDVYDEQTIDSQIGLPQKILIPERYIEVESENISASERLRRSLKASNIRKMLTESVAYEDIGARDSVEEVHSKVGEEKRRRAHLLALNHSIAKEVMERSKMVAAHITPVE